MSILRQLIIAAAVLAFFVIWAIVLIQVWNAKDGQVAAVDGVLVGAGAALAGAIGAGFALAMGIEKSKPPDASLALAGGLPKVDSDEARGVILAVGIYGYAIVAALTLLTWIANRSETPDDVRALAVGFAGYVLSLVTAAFSAVRASD